MYYSQRQIERANETDLESFLRDRGENLRRSGKDMEWEKHDSLKIRGNKWHRFSNNTGGYPIEFVMEFYGKSFPEAMEMLIGEKGEGQRETVPAPSPEFRLPMRNVTNANAKKYLIEERGLTETLVDLFIDRGDIYEEEKTHNVVFVGRDANNMPRYAHRRETNGGGRKDVLGSDKAYGFSYKGNSDKLYVYEAPIDLLSFINLFPKNWKDYSYVSLGGISNKALIRFINDYEKIQTIYLCLDSDEAGETACQRLNLDIPEDKKVYRLKPILKDWNEVLLHKDEIQPNEWYVLSAFRDEREAIVPMIRMSDVYQTEVEFLWKPYIPFGKLTILHGDAGNGKTYVAMQLCAACTNKVEIPNMKTLEPFNVIYQTAEDGLGDTIKPRLIEAGADLDRVLVIDEGDGEPLTLSDERIEKAIRQNKARLLIIDPIQAFIGEKVDMNRANEVRSILRKIGDIAQRTGCAILLIGHLNKAAGLQSGYRGLGSIDFIAGVRSVLIIGKSKEDQNLRVLAHDKSSLAPPGVSIAFILGDEEGFRWMGDYDVTADEMLLGVEKKKETKTKEAKDLICQMLAGGRQVFCDDIDKAALARGISSRTVRDAKRELGETLKSKIGEGRRKIYWMN